MARWRLDIAYDGGAFGGWQYQKPEGGPVLPSIQGELAAALSQLLGGAAVAPQNLQAAGRTDAGVHALNQVVHVDVEKPLDAINLLDGLNHFLPRTVRVRAAEAVGDDFHARHSAHWRAYRYVLVQARHLRPDQYGHVGHVRLGLHYPALDVDAMQAELEQVGPGEHDFSGLQDAECQSTTPLCTLLSWRVFTQADALGEQQIILEAAADHFLHHMMRNLVGVLVAVGSGKKQPGELARVLAGRDRTQADITFSPSGLYLWRIGYTAFQPTNLA